MTVKESDSPPAIGRSRVQVVPYGGESAGAGLPEHENEGSLVYVCESHSTCPADGSRGSLLLPGSTSSSLTFSAVSDERFVTVTTNVMVCPTASDPLGVTPTDTWRSALAPDAVAGSIGPTASTARTAMALRGLLRRLAAWASEDRRWRIRRSSSYPRYESSEPGRW